MLAPAVRIAKPKVFIPVFPGTNCEYDLSKAFEDAGATVNVEIFKNLKANDIFTIRGMGKFILNGVLGNTKKDRLRISVFYFR